MKLNDLTLGMKARLLGKTVRWSSQAHGSETTKEGIVVYAGPRYGSRGRGDRPDLSALGCWLSTESMEEWVRADPRTRAVGAPRRQHGSCAGIIVRVQGKTYPNFYAPSGSTELEIVSAEEGAADGKP